MLECVGFGCVREGAARSPGDAGPPVSSEAMWANCVEQGVGRRCASGASLGLSGPSLPQAPRQPSLSEGCVLTPKPRKRPSFSITLTPKLEDCRHILDQSDLDDLERELEQFDLRCQQSSVSSESNAKATLNNESGGMVLDYAHSSCPASQSTDKEFTFAPPALSNRRMLHHINDSCHNLLVVAAIGRSPLSSVSTDAHAFSETCGKRVVSPRVCATVASSLVASSESRELPLPPRFAKDPGPEPPSVLELLSDTPGLGTENNAASWVPEREDSWSCGVEESEMPVHFPRSGAFTPMGSIGATSHVRSVWSLEESCPTWPADEDAFESTNSGSESEDGNSDHDGEATLSQDEVVPKLRARADRRGYFIEVEQISWNARPPHHGRRSRRGQGRGRAGQLHISTML